jgi:methanogenic corrinoid protein MtbC1
MNALHQQVCEALHAGRSELVAETVTREFARYPELEERYGKSVRERMLEDTGYHFAYLGQAIYVGRTELFVDYLGWAKVMLAKRGVPTMYLASLFESMKDAFRAKLPPEISGVACDYLEIALRQLPSLPDEAPTFISEDDPHATLAASYLQALLRGKRHIASKLILDAVEQGVAVRDLYLHVFQRTQYEIGRLWQVNQISVAQEHYCTAATQLIMSQLYPHIFGANKTRGTVVAACVAGDMHEIGARMVCDFFELEGWHTHYLGANVPTPSIVQTLVECKANFLAISATIAYHLRAVEALIAAVRRTSECSGVKILVGGYPFKVVADLWRSVGADGSANDAQEAVALANQFSASPRAA